MKYIRTKDGIYKRMFPDYEKHRISFDHKTIEPAYFTTNYEWVAKKDVINQANTIEELCDTFVAIGHMGIICAYNTFKELKTFDFILHGEYQKFIEKYGAIHPAELLRS